jgi:hypothetical protein
VGTQSPGSSPTAVNPPAGDTIHPSQSNPEIAASQRAAAATGEEEHVERAPLSVDMPRESEEAAQAESPPLINGNMNDDDEDDNDTSAKANGNEKEEEEAMEDLQFSTPTKLDDELPPPSPSLLVSPLLCGNPAMQLRLGFGVASVLQDPDNMRATAERMAAISASKREKETQLQRQAERQPFSPSQFESGSEKEKEVLVASRQQGTRWSHRNTKWRTSVPGERILRIHHAEVGEGQRGSSTVDEMPPLQVGSASPSPSKEVCSDVVDALDSPNDGDASAASPGRRGSLATQQCLALIQELIEEEETYLLRLSTLQSMFLFPLHGDRRGSTPALPLEHSDFLLYALEAIFNGSTQFQKQLRQWIQAARDNDHDNVLSTASAATATGSDQEVQESVQGRSQWEQLADIISQHMSLWNMYMLYASCALSKVEALEKKVGGFSPAFDKLVDRCVHSASFEGMSPFEMLRLPLNRCSDYAAALERCMKLLDETSTAGMMIAESFVVIQSAAQQAKALLSRSEESDNLRLLAERLNLPELVSPGRTLQVHSSIRRILERSGMIVGIDYYLFNDLLVLATDEPPTVVETFPLCLLLVEEMEGNNKYHRAIKLRCGSRYVLVTFPKQSEKEEWLAVLSTAIGREQNRTWKEILPRFPCRCEPMEEVSAVFAQLENWRPNMIALQECKALFEQKMAECVPNPEEEAEIAAMDSRQTILHHLALEMQNSAKLSEISAVKEVLVEGIANCVVDDSASVLKVLHKLAKLDALALDDLSRILAPFQPEDLATNPQ